MAIPAKNLLLSFLCLGVVDGYAKNGDVQTPIHTVPASSVQILENKGQITDQYGKQRKDIDFKIENGGVTMFGGKGKLHYQWQKENQKEKVKNKKEEHLPSQGEIYRLDVTLVGSNPNAEVVFEDPTGYYENYYLSQCPDGATAKGYSKITYKNSYPNIDWVVYTNSNADNYRDKSQNPKDEFATAIKYDFIIHPGGKPADIKLRYDGAADLKLVDGSLLATTPFGTITEDVPYSYEAETKKEVISKYILNGNELRFDVGQYEGTLVIDPTLKWATYYGGTDYDLGEGVAVSLYEDVYMSGISASTSNIATTGAHQFSHSVTNTDFDGFLVKFNESGARQWATYYGGTSTELVMDVAVDREGNVYISGLSSSTGAIATSGAHKSINTGTGNNHDGFLAKFTSAGVRLWGTYYGGHGYDRVNAICLDDSANIYVCGNTDSDTGIATSGSFINTRKSVSGTTGFLAKFNTNGTRQWGTYFGDSNFIYLADIALDISRNVVVSGLSDNSYTATMATTGAHQVVGGGGRDGIIAKLNNNGQRLWTSYYGGSLFDEIHSLGTDDTGNIYFCGLTSSNNNIASTNGHVTVNAGGGDMFVVKFNPSGARQWGTYHGAADFDYAEELVMSADGGLYITGTTYSSTGIPRGNPHQPNFGGGNGDAFIAKYSLSGIITYCSYYGGTGQDFTNANHSGATGSNKGRLYFTGVTTSTNGIATTNGYYNTYQGGSQDAFLVAFETDTVAYIPQRYSDTVWCPGDTVRIVYGVNKAFNIGNIFTIQLSNATGSFAAPITIGSHADTTGDTITCIIPSNTPAGTGYRIRVAASNPMRASWNNQWDIRIKANPAAFSNTSNSPVCEGDTLRLLGSTSSTGVTWLWAGPNSFTSGIKDTIKTPAALSDSGKYILKVTLNSTGCYLRDTATVTIKPLPSKPIAASNSPVCETLPLTLSTSSSTSGVSYSWNGPGSYTNGTQNPTVTNSAAATNAGYYISTVTINGCSNRDTVTVIILPKPTKPTAGAVNTSLCARQDLQLTATSITGANYNWYGPAGYSANTQNPVRNYMQFSYAGKYHVYATVSGCISDTDGVTVVVNTDPIVNIFPTPGTTICPGQQAIFTAIPTNGGTAPTYQWRVNGIPTGGTGVSYNTTTLNNGDIVTCHMTSTTTCSTPFTDTSNAISMTVLPKLTPSVTISANPNTSLHPNEPINFTATPSQAGTAPTYQWRRNGKNVSGATGATWGANANALSDGDEICVLLKSSYQCPDPDTALSNCIKLDIRLGIVGMASGTGGIKVYPNPTTGSLTITSSVKIEKVEISNLLGQKLVSQNGNSTTMTIDMQKFAAGVYVIKVNDSYVERVVKE